MATNRYQNNKKNIMNKLFSEIKKENPFYLSQYHNELLTVFPMEDDINLRTSFFIVDRKTLESKNEKQLENPNYPYYMITSKENQPPTYTGFSTKEEFETLINKIYYSYLKTHSNELKIFIDYINNINNDETKKLSSSDLKMQYQINNPDGHYFDKETMRFFGDDLKNLEVKDCGDTWDLFRKRDTIPNPPNNNIIQKAGYLTSFSKDNFEELGDIKNDLYHTTTLPERMIKNANIKPEKQNQYSINNPENIQYDLLLLESQNDKLSLLNNKNILMKKYDGWKNNEILEIIAQNNPGRVIAIQSLNSTVKPYAIPLGYEADIKNKNNNHFINKLRDYIVNSIENNTSVLLTQREGIDYSINAVTAKPYTSIQQLYLQQVRKDNNYKSPYFTQSSDKTKPINKTLGTIMADYNKKEQTLKYYFVYNFNQLNLKVNKPTISKKQNSIVIERKNIKTKDLADRLSYELEYNVSNYFNSIYSGVKYAPTQQFINDKSSIIQHINTNQIHLFEAIDSAYKTVSKVRINSDKKQKELDQKQRTQQPKKGRVL